MRRRFWVIVAGLALAGCQAAVDMHCRTDGDCAVSSACAAGICLARPTTPLGGVGIALWPPSASDLAVTEYAAQTLGNGAIFKLDRKVFVSGTIARTEAGTALAGAFTVAVAVPSALPNSPPLEFETTAAGSDSSNPPFAFSLSLPERLLGTMATFVVRPLLSPEEDVPPWREIRPLADGLRLHIPSTSDLVSLSGTLQDALGKPPQWPYNARAFIGTQLVSSVGRTDGVGKFALNLARGLLPGPGLAGVTVEFESANAQVALPMLRLSHLTDGQTDLGMIQFPAFVSPQNFRIPVRSADTGSPVAGAIVTFHTTVPGTRNGETFYQRSGRTDGTGTAQIPLLPGLADMTREYAVTVAPDENADVAARCVAKYSVPFGTTDATRVGAAIELASKVVVKGRILTADQVPLADIRVVATPIDDASGGQCPDPLPTPYGRTTSQPNGGYQLLLEPGRYHFDYQPSVGTPAPPFRESLVTVAGPLSRDVTLPSALVVDGQIENPEGLPVPACDVWGYLPWSGGNVEGRGRTSENGRFRLLFPQAR